MHFTTILASLRDKLNEILIINDMVEITDEQQGRKVTLLMEFYDLIEQLIISLAILRSTGNKVFDNGQYTILKNVTNGIQDATKDQLMLLHANLYTVTIILKFMGAVGEEGYMNALLWLFNPNIG